MKSILEKAIVHLLNGDQDKAETLFHKFMVEKARHIHESLRQEDDADLSEGWDDEIKEEEYFDNDDLASVEDKDDEMDGDMDADVDDMDADTTDMDADVDDMDADTTDMDADVDDMDADMDSVEGEEHTEIADKLDDIEDKISELTAEFDKLMSEFGNEEGHDDSEFSDMEGDDFGNEGDLEDTDGEEPNMDADETDDLADRMDDDMGTDDGEKEPEEETMESVDMDDELDEDLNDITESVLSELDKVASPGNTDGKEIGSGGKTISGSRTTAFPHHGVNDRIAQAKPYMIGMQGTGGDNDSFERETAPGVKPVQTMVDKTRPGNVRKSYKDTMERKSKEGDSSAALNKNFAGGEDKGRSPVDGKTKPKTR